MGGLGGAVGSDACLSLGWGAVVVYALIKKIINSSSIFFMFATYTGSRHEIFVF